MGFKTLTKKRNASNFLNSARGETDETEALSQNLEEMLQKAQNLSKTNKFESAVSAKKELPHQEAQPLKTPAKEEAKAAKKGLKRNKTILLYFSPEELELIKSQAEAMYMNVNQYIRFKLFFGANKEA